jgi:hypothetical protein
MATSKAPQDFINDEDHHHPWHRMTHSIALQVIPK